jgi:quinoprotein glucose dehydrogenase
VKRNLLVLAAVLGVTAVLPILAQSPAQRPDLSQPQSPAKPAPEGLKFIDQGQFDPRLKGYRTPEGLRLEIVAEQPTVINPVGMTFGPDGTLYVLEWVPTPGNQNFPEVLETFTYKDGSKRKIATMKKPVKDVVKRLHSTAGNGIYDKAEIIIEHELPSSILIHDGWIYLSGRGTIQRYRQSVPGGKYDVRETIAQGFCGFHHHQVSGMTIGNDGLLYITSGDDDNYVEGSDGSRATVLRTGAVFRCRPDGSKMEVYSIGWRNPYRDLVFDERFNWFHADNDNEDGSKFTGCRLMHVAQDSDFGWRLLTGARCCRPDHVRGAVLGELPGKLPPMLKTGRGSPAGLLCYNDSFLPPDYQGVLYYPDVFRRLVRAYWVAPVGSTFEVTHEYELIKTDDPLFRPCQMITGPDGAIYLCDWRTDSGGAGKLWGDGVHGRIYRLRWVGTADTPAIPLRPLDSWAKIASQDNAGLIAALDSPNQTDRLVAQQTLRKRGPAVRGELLKLLADQDANVVARLHAMGTLHSFWDKDVHAAFLKALGDKEPDVRRLAAEGLAQHAPAKDPITHEALLKILGEPELAVRRAVALAIGTINAPGAADALVNAYRFDDGKDVYLTDGYLRAIERTGNAGIQALINLATSGSDANIQKVVDAFAALRIPEAAAAIPVLLGNPHLTIEQRATVIASYANYQTDPPISLEPLLTYLERNPNEARDVQLAALRTLALGATIRNPRPHLLLGSLTAGLGNPNPWTVPVDLSLFNATLGERARADRASRLILKLLDSADTDVRLAAIRTIEDTRLGPAAGKLGRLLADPTRPLPERLAIVRALRVLDDPATVPALVNLATNIKSHDTDAVNLRLESLRTLAVLAQPQAAELARSLISQGDTPVSLQAEAVSILGTSPAGARLVGEAFVAKKLARELLPQVSETLRRHAAKDATLQQLLGEVMRGGLSVSTTPDELVRIARLVQTTGSPSRGRALYLNAKQLACINCHRLEGIGGHIGPDLTRIWETLSLEKTVESIVHPSAEIKEGFQTYVLVTDKGISYSGLKLVDTPQEVVLRDANGKDVRVPRNQIEELYPTKNSLMPDNLITQLSYQQFIDLIAFLRDRTAQESLRGLGVDFWVAGPFGHDHTTSNPPEKQPDPKAVYPATPQSNGQPIRWVIQQVQPTGYLDLRAVFNRDTISAYALTYVYSPKSQRVTMLTGSDDTIRVWINGKLVHNHDVPRAAKADDDRVEVDLPSGWSPVLIHVTNRTGDHGFYLRFSGGEGIRLSLRPDELK